MVVLLGSWICANDHWERVLCYSKSQAQTQNKRRSRRITKKRWRRENEFNHETCLRKRSIIYLLFGLWRVIWISSEFGKIGEARFKEKCHRSSSLSSFNGEPSMISRMWCQKWWLKWTREGINSKPFASLTHSLAFLHVSVPYICTRFQSVHPNMSECERVVFFSPRFACWMQLHDNILKRETLRLKINMKRLTAQFAF